MIRKDQQATMHKKGNKIQKALQISNGPPRRSRTVKGETADCIPSSLTLPKLYLATLKSQGHRDKELARASQPLPSINYLCSTTWKPKYFLKTVKTLPNAILLFSRIFYCVIYVLFLPFMCTYM